jgi:hypothetical protein
MRADIAAACGSEWTMSGLKRIARVWRIERP